MVVVLCLNALHPFKGLSVFVVDGVKLECVGLVCIPFVCQLLLASRVKEMVLVEGCNPGLVDVAEPCSLWQVPDLVYSVQLLLSQGQVASEVVDVLDCILSEELLDHQLPAVVGLLDMQQVCSAFLEHQRTHLDPQVQLDRH